MPSRTVTLSNIIQFQSTLAKGWGRRADEAFPLGQGVFKPLRDFFQDELRNGAGETGNGRVEVDRLAKEIHGIFARYATWARSTDTSRAGGATFDLLCARLLADIIAALVPGEEDRATLSGAFMLLMIRQSE